MNTIDFVLTDAFARKTSSIFKINKYENFTTFWENQEVGAYYDGDVLRVIMLKYIVVELMRPKGNPVLVDLTIDPYYFSL